MKGKDAVEMFKRWALYFFPYDEPKGGRPSAVQTVLFGFLLVVALCLSLKDYESFQLGTYRDDSCYVVLAESIAFHGDYGLIHVPGDPHPTHYPFGFPWLLSPFAKAFPDDPGSMKWLSLGATLLNAFLLFWGWPHLSRSRSFWWGLGIAALYLVSPVVVGHTRMVMSEPIFTSLLLLGLILCERYLAGLPSRPLAHFLAGIVAFFAFAVRGIGITLIAAIGVRVLMLPVSFASKAKRLLFFVLGGIFLFLVAMATTPVTFHDLIPTEYAAKFGDSEVWGEPGIEEKMIPRMMGAVRDYTKQHVKEMILPIGGGQRERELGRRLGVPHLPLLTGIAIGAMVFLGHLSLWRKRGLEPSATVLEFSYLGVLLIWPWRGGRFLYPFQPFLVYYALWGVKLLVGGVRHFRFIPVHMKPILVNGSGAAFFTLLLLLSLYKSFSEDRDSLQYVRDLRVGSTWLRQNSPPDAVVMAEQPQSIYLYSRRKTVLIPRVSSLEEFRSHLDEEDIQYLLVAPEVEWRQDGELVYSDYTRQKVLPWVEELLSSGQAARVYQSEEDKVDVYRVGP